MKRHLNLITSQHNIAIGYIATKMNLRTSQQNITIGYIATTMTVQHQEENIGKMEKSLLDNLQKQLMKKNEHDSWFETMAGVKKFAENCADKIIEWLKT